MGGRSPANASPGQNSRGLERILAGTDPRRSRSFGRGEFGARSDRGRGRTRAPADVSGSRRPPPRGFSKWPDMLHCRRRKARKDAAAQIAPIAAAAAWGCSCIACRNLLPDGVDDHLGENSRRLPTALPPWLAFEVANVPWCPSAVFDRKSPGHLPKSMCTPRGSKGNK